MDFVFNVDELPMDAKGAKDAESVCSVENVIQKITEGSDVVIAHTTIKDEECQPNWDDSCEVYQSKETVEDVSARAGDG